MRCHLALVALALAASSSLSAQRRSWPRNTETLAIEETAITGIGMATATLLAPADRRMRVWAVGPGRQVPGLAALDAVFRPMGGHVPLMLAGGVWLAGTAAGHEEVGAGGRIAAESIATTMLLKGVVQRVVGRMRPNTEPHNPWDFRLGRGFRDRSSRSFPSGHAANAFALAGAVNEELHHLNSRADSWVSPLLYGAASATSFSRVVADEHWLSDVVAGAVLGGVTAALIADANGR